MSGRPGRVRGARLTDLAALGELSRLSHPGEDQDGKAARSYRAGHFKAPSAGRVSSRIQFRYAVDPATMGSAMISGSS